MANKKKIKGNEIAATKVYENPEALQDQIVKTQDFATRNRNLIAGVLTVFVLLIGAFFWYRWDSERQSVLAQEQIFPAEFYFQKDSLQKALYGDGNFTDGFLKIADNFGSTPSGNLAKFYAGVIFMRQGEYEQAIKYLKGFDSDDFLIQARAYALIGDAHVELNNLGDAVTHYKKAANYKPNDQFTPGYLLKLAFVYEQQGNQSEAKATYDKIINEFSKSAEVRDARKYAALLQ